MGERRFLCSMEDQDIGCFGQAGEQERMTLYEKPSIGRVLGSRLLLFAAIGPILTPSTATENRGPLSRDLQSRREETWGKPAGTSHVLRVLTVFTERGQRL